MKEAIVVFASQFPPELATALLAAVPVGELRLALPVGIGLYGLHPAAAFAYAYLGNVIPLILVYATLPFLIRFAAEKSPRIDGLLKKYFLHLERKYKDRYDRYGRIILLIFVAIPLPGSGVWTASIVAILFGIEAAFAIPAILVGLALSAGVVLTLSELFL